MERTRALSLSEADPLLAAVALGTPAAVALGTPAAADPMESGVVTTFSTVVVVKAGEAVANVEIPIPPCPSGERFLVRSLAAAPDPRYGWPTSGRWAVSVVADQYSRYGFFEVPLTAYAQGQTHVELELPAGQATYGSSLYVSVYLLGWRPTTPAVFDVHVSGACGVPSQTR